MISSKQNILFTFLFFLTNLSLHAQQIRINEVVSSNAVHFDEDGDAPDWFELHNYGSDTISLVDWTISDKIDQPDKWTFPVVRMAPDDYLLLWASGKDRKVFGISRTLITQGAEFRYIIPSQAVSTQWTSLGFDDANWNLGTSGIGYGDGDDETEIPQGIRSVFLRKKFSVANVAAIQELIFDIDYDDAFVAYINGVEIARANIEGNPPDYNARSITDHEAALYQGGQPDRFIITNPADLLQTDENILSIQAHNVGSSSSDFTIIPFLSAFYAGTSTEGILPPDLLQLPNRSLHTNFKISSGGETLYLFENTGNLVDSLQVKDLPHDVSLGIPPGGGTPAYYDIPTPGLPNEGDGFLGVSDAIIDFSHPGGPTSSLILTLGGVSSPDIIRYTLDANIPDENSPIYTEPISITANTVVRARAFRPDYLPSATQSRTYLIGASHDLPVISLVTEPHNFFDDDHGIYVLGDTYEADFPYFGSNFWQDWERPIHFTLYEKDGLTGLAFNGGAKIFGGWSRGNAQRSFSIFARKQYGPGEINYPLFPDQPRNVYQSFVLRNSGNDWLNTMMRDAALTGLMKGTGLEYQAYRPAIAYLNGEYWGLYNMREKVSEHFLASRYNLNPEDIDLLETNSRVIHGDNEDYMNLTNFLSNNDLVTDENYQIVAQEIDVENYIIYQVAQIYFDNTDWPGNNYKFWKPKGGKWRWILFDTDFGFGIWNTSNSANNTLAFALEPNGPGWPNPPWSTFLFRKMVENITFRNALVNRFADEMNSRFLPKRVREHIDTLSVVISTEIEAHYTRWEGNAGNWYTQVNNMKNFGNARPTRMKQHILSVFDLPAYHPLTIENEDPGKGYVKINRLNIKEENWTGDYFEEVPVKVVAIPEQGYAFSHWSNGSLSTDAELEVNITAGLTLVPHFEATTIPERAIVINEINYSSSDNFDTGDWVELYNPNPYALNLSNWIFKDSDDSHEFVLPDGTFIAAEGYLILSKDIDKFNSFYPDIENVIGNFDFGLSGQSDMVRIYDSFGTLRDAVEYFSVSPWPEGAAGTGATIELVNPSLDNSLPESWAILHSSGSPAAINFFESDTTFQEMDQNVMDIKYFPNPFRDEITLTFRVQQPTTIKATLYDEKGALIRSVVNRNLSPGNYRVAPNLNALSPGIYFLEFVEGGEKVQVLKWVKL